MDSAWNARPEARFRPRENQSPPSPFSFLGARDVRVPRRSSMLTKHLAAALVGTAFLTVPALAQTTAPAGNPPASTTTTAASANAGHFVTQEKAGQWRASKLKGLNVYNNNN